MRGAPVWLARLMSYHGLSPKLRIKPEEDLSIRYANALRVAALEGRLRAYGNGLDAETATGFVEAVMLAINDVADWQAPAPISPAQGLLL